MDDYGVGVFEAGGEGAAVDVVEFVAEGPVVFGVVDLEVAVWRDAGLGWGLLVRMWGVLCEGEGRMLGGGGSGEVYLWIELCVLDGDILFWLHGTEVGAEDIGGWVKIC